MHNKVLTPYVKKAVIQMSVYYKNNSQYRKETKGYVCFLLHFSIFLICYKILIFMMQKRLKQLFQPAFLFYVSIYSQNYTLNLHPSVTFPFCGYS